jgi:hypothetical protein
MTLATRWKFWLLVGHLLSSLVFVYFFQLHESCFGFSLALVFGKPYIKPALKLDWKNPSLHQSSEVYFLWLHLADRWLLTGHLLSSEAFVYILQLHKTFFWFSVWDFGKRYIKPALKLDWKNPSLHQSSEVYFLWLHLADRCNQCSKSPIKNKIRDKVWFTIMKPHLALPGTAHCKV